jgi:hypothetical protein
MRELINIIDLVEAKEEDIGPIKKTIVSMVKTVDEKSVLKKVLQILQAGNLDERVENVVKTDADAKVFIRQITSAILGIDAPIEEKDKFLNNYTKGIINVSKLLDGSAHTFAELVGEGFPEELFTQLSVSLTSQGVGPGEVALAVFSPKIKWSGRAPGGGDIVVDGKNVEVKTSIKAGGRWINARKANMNMPAIKDAIATSTSMEVPDRLGLNAWVNTFRPAINKRTLPKVCKIIGKGLFTAVETSAFEETLATGDAKQIQDEMLQTGFENYKKLSGFDGMLMMDVGSKTAQYFNSYDDMAGSIKVDSAYLYGPEGEAMPKVSLRVSDSSKTADSKGKTSKEQKNTTDKPVSNKDFTDKAAQIATGKSSKKSTAPEVGDVGRAKRK